MVLRRSVVLGVTTALTAALCTAALGAGHRPSCRLVVDAPGDDRGGGAASSGSLDLVSADVASDARLLTLVIRLRDLTDTATAPSGGSWELAFTLRGERFFARANRAPDGDEFLLEFLHESVGDEDNGGATFGYLGRIDGVIDEDLGEVRMHVPVRLLRPYGLQPGASISELRADSRTHVGTNTSVPVFQSFPTGVISGGNHAAGGDTATSDALYAAGTPSCVTPGR